jgi:hypothetical protein
MAEYVKDEGVYQPCLNLDSLTAPTVPLHVNSRRGFLPPSHVLAAAVHTAANHVATGSSSPTGLPCMCWND